MSSRSSGLRIKVVAMLLSLVALWVFAATVTLREGVNLLAVSTLGDKLGTSTESLLADLQQERRLSLVALGGATPAERVALVSQRERTDKTIEKWQEYATSGSAKRAASDKLEVRIDQTIDALIGLDGVRGAIDARTVDRPRAAAMYTDVVNSGFRIYSSLSTLDDEAIARDSRTLVALSRAREVLSQEDALLAGAIAAAKFGPTEHQQFVQLSGAQRFLYAEVEAELPAADRARYRELVSGPLFNRFRDLENVIITKGGPNLTVPVSASAWNSVVAPVFEGLRQLELNAADGLIERATPAAVWVIVRLLLAGGLGLLAVIASIVMAITTARSLVRQLEKLRGAALGLAIERLPRVVERLRAGEEVDVAAEVPPLSFGTDEIGQVGRAFNLVQETAVQVAVEQAALRKGVRDVFLSLARRSQALVHRQLTLLDTMERRETSPEELENLFRVDHLATRMRRNAENLIVLSGAVPGRGWRNPVPLVDVVRGAVAEVEEYERVTVAQIGSASLAGRAVGDIIHLLAELVENALSFSPPHTMVHVSGELVGNGFAVEIEDRGLGMSEADLDAANAQLANPPEFNLTSTARLGLYVVGRLSERHQLRVRLRTSPYGGVTAVVLIPSALVVNAQPSDILPTAERDRLATARAAILAGQPLEGAAGVRTPDGAGDITASLAASRRERGIPRVRDASAARALTALPAERTAEPVAPNGTEPASTTESPSTTETAEPANPDTAETGVSTEAPAEQPLPVRTVAETAAPTEARPAQPRPEETELAEPGVAETQAIMIPAETLNGTPLPYGATRPAEVEVRTPSGLPRRVRQASLAAPLRGDAPLDDDEAALAAPRAPEETRNRLASYQRGTLRGRTDADQVDDAETEETGQNSGDR